MNKEIYMNNDTYTHTCNCPNCREPNIVKIPKSQTIASYLRAKHCNNCGCKLRQAEKQNNV